MTPVPRTVAHQLATSYQNLPPRSIRWRTIAGRDFQRQLWEVVDTYGAADTARAIGLTRQAVAAILRQPTVRDTDAIAWPAVEELVPLIEAWGRIQRLNRRQLSVRSDSREFRRMQQVVTELLQHYRLDIISRAAGIPLRRLRKYQPEHEEGEARD